MIKDGVVQPTFIRIYAQMRVQVVTFPSAMSSRVLPDVGFTLYPEEKKTVAPQPPSTFVSEGKLSYPAVIKADSPFQANPSPVSSAPTPAFDTKRVDNLEKRLAEYAAENAALKQSIVTLVARIDALAAEVANVSSRVVSNPFVDAEILDAFVKDTEATIDDGGVEETKNCEPEPELEIEPEPEPKKEEEREVRTIVLPAKTSSSITKRTRDPEEQKERVAKVIESVKGRSERDLNTNLKASEITDMLAVLGKQYVPPKLEGVRLLMKAVAELHPPTSPHPE